MTTECEESELSVNLYLLFSKSVSPSSLLSPDLLVNRTIAIALTKIGFHQNFYTIQILMANVLGLDACKHYKERQANIQNRVKTLLDEKFHCIFNDIFHVQVTAL